MNKEIWQQEMIQSFRNINDLLDFLSLSFDQVNEILNLNPIFPIQVPLPYAQKIEKNNINDPLLLQVLPLVQENTIEPLFSIDPVGDNKAKTESGIIHKYKNRVLLPLTGNCAINCRYCFRQHYAYDESSYNDKRFNKSLEYILNDANINEVILSGGDPLSLKDSVLEDILMQLNRLSQLSVIRIHTRFPVTIPNRLTRKLSTILGKLKKQIIIVFHINHSNEIDETFKDKLDQFKKGNISFLNQAVLLKKVNDNFEALSNLSKKLIDYGILPYYLNQLDKVQGAKHFEVSIKEGIRLVQQLRENLSGYMVPRYIQEIAGENNKTIIL